MTLRALLFSFLATAGVATAQSPTIILSPTTAGLSAPVGSGLSVPKGVNITSSGGAITALQRTISYAAGQPTGWLKATLAGTTTPALLGLQGDASLTLPAGTYDAIVTVRSKGSAIAPQAVAVTFTVNNLVPAIGVAATATLTAPAGSLTPVSLKLDVANNGGGKLGGLQSSITYPPGETPGWLTAALGGTDAPTKLTLRATPSQYLLTGTHHATVHIRSSNASDTAQVDVSFNLTGINPAIALSPASVTFIAIIGTGNPAPQSISITNLGGGTADGLKRSITYAAGEPTGWLNAALGGSSAPTTLVLSAVNTGALAPGVYTATVLLTSTTAYNSPQAMTVTLGVGNSPAHLTMTPTVHDFGSVGVGGASAAQAFTITNDGGLPSGPFTPSSGSFGFVLGGPNPGDFRPDPTSSCIAAAGGLAPHTSCDIVFWFSPTAAGARAAGLGVSASPGGTVTAALSGTGTTDQVIIVTPPSFDFGTFGAGLPATTQRFVLTNPLPWPTGPLQQIPVPGFPPAPLMNGPNPGDFYLDPNSSCVQVLSTGMPVGGSCYFDVTFLPTDLGARSAVLAFQMTPGGVVQIAFSGNSLATGFLTITPTTKDFGSIGIGGASAAQAFTITNNGVYPSGPFTPSSGSFGIVLGGLNPGDFLADPTSSCAGAAGGLAPHASCDIVFRFSPTAVGARSAGLSLSASPGGTVTAGLSGTGTTDQVIIVTPPSHDYGDVGVGASSAPQRFVLTNPLPWPTGPLQPLSGGLGGAAGILAGPNPGDFYFDPNSSCVQVLPTGLPVGGSCYFDVSLIPQGLGPRSATLVFQMTPGGVVQIPFSGNGVAAQLLTLSPASLDFGLLDVGTTSPPQRVTLTNTGVTATGRLVPQGPGGANPGDFNFTLVACAVDASGSLPPGGTCVFDVTFTPTADGTRTASVSFAATPGGTATLSLTGDGVFRISAFIISPTTHDYGDVIVGQRSTVQDFTVTNLTGRDVALAAMGVLGTGSGNYGLDGTSSCISGPSLLPDGGSCTLGVFFMPQAMGAIPGTLLVITYANDTASASLTGTGGGVAALAFTPASYDFGPVSLGLRNTQATLTVTNSGSAAAGPLSSTVVGDVYDFSITGCTGVTLAPASSCTFTIFFQPLSTGPRHATLTVSWNGGTISAAITGSGAVVTSPTLVISAAQHDFGSVLVGQTSATHTFTVTNTGPARPGVGLFQTINDEFQATPFNIDPCFRTTFPAGATCFITVTFTPQSAGARTGTLIFSTTDGFTVTASLTGTGVAAFTNLTLTPASKDFGNLVVGLTSPVAPFTVTNTGSVRSGPLQTFSLGGADAADYVVDPGTCLGLALDPGATCTVNVTFNPTAPGSRAASLTVGSSNNESVTGSLTGTGEVLSLAPGFHDFGNRQVGFTGGGVFFFTITNSGSSPTGPLDEFDFTGANPGDFSIDDQRCLGVSLAPGASCSLSVQFIPQATGLRSAAIRVGSSADGSTGSAALTGTGVPPAVLTVTPASKDFGSVIVGQTSAQMTFTLTNTSAISAGLYLTDGITGTGSVDYTFHPFECGSISVDPGQSCRFWVWFHPSGLGPRPTTLDIVFQGGTALVSLTGTGIPLSISAAAATRDLLGAPSLSDAERVFLDVLGNHDGTYDLGDLLAYLKRNHLKVSPALVGGAARRTENIP